MATQITANFAADFTKFVTAVNQAETRLKGFQSESTKVEASLARVADAFSGRKILQEATLATKAVQDIGGVTKLTEAEQKRLNVTLTEAMAKYNALGIEAPKSMRDLAAQTHAAASAGGGLVTWIRGAASDVVKMAAGFFTAQAAFAAVKGAIRLVVDELKLLTVHGAAVDDVTQNFEHLTAQSGRLGQTLIGALRAGTHGTIADFELMKLATQDLAAGLNLTDAQFGTLAKGAFALAQATGGDVATALDTMNDAMLTGRTRSLALLTGKIDLEKAETAFARSLGVTRDRLSEEGKLEAARRAILESVGAAVDRLGEQTDGLDERIAQARTTWANFQNELGRTVASSPVILTALDNIAKALTGTFGPEKSDLVRQLAGVIDDAAIAFVELAKVAVQASGFIIKEYHAVNKLLGNTAQIVDGVRLAFLFAQQSAMLASGDIANWKKLDDQIGHLMQTMLQRGKALQDEDRAQDNVNATTGKYVKVLDDLIVKMEAARRSGGSFERSIGAAGSASQDLGQRVSTLGQQLGAVGGSARAGGDGLNYLKDASNEAGKAIQNLTDKLEGTKEIQNLEKAFRALTPAQRANAEIVKEVLQRYTDLRQKVGSDLTPALETLFRQTGTLTNQFRGLSASMVTVPPAITDTKASLNAYDLIVQDSVELAGEQAVAIRATEAELRRLGAVLPDVAQEIGNVSQEVEKSTGLFGHFTDSVKNLWEGMSKGRGLSGLFSNLGDSLIQGFGNLLSQGIASLVNLALKGLVGLGKKIWGAITGGPSEAEREGRETAAAFRKSLEEGLSASQLAEATAAGFGDAAAIIAIRDALIDLGRDAGEAEVLVRRLWEAERRGPEAVKQVMAEVNALMADHEALLDLISRHDLSFADFEGPAQARLFGEELARLTQEFDALTQAGVSHQAIVRVLGEEYAAFVEQALALGLEIPPMLQTIAEEWEAMGETAAGALAGITDPLELLTAQLDLGDTLEDLQDNIDKAIRSGQGNFRDLIRDVMKLQDVIGDTEDIRTLQRLLSEAAQSGTLDFQRFSEILAKLKAEWAQGINIPVNFDLTASASGFEGEGGTRSDRGGYLTPEEAREAGVAWRPHSEFDWSDSINRTIRDEDISELNRLAEELRDAEERLSGGATGGIVTPQGIQHLQYGGPVRWRPQGTDTVPAMLTPGEGILSQRGMAALGRLNAGQGLGGYSYAELKQCIVDGIREGMSGTAIEMDGERVSRAVARRLPGVLATMGVRAA